jgi:hypothetical protein
MAERERAWYHGRIVTIVAENRRTVDVRDEHGFVIERVPKREVEKLNEQDYAAKFKI